MTRLTKSDIERLLEKGWDLNCVDEIREEIDALERVGFTAYWDRSRNMFHVSYQHLFDRYVDIERFSAKEVVEFVMRLGFDKHDY